MASDSTVDWSELPPELSELILDRLTNLSDHIRFASVCSSWQSSINTISYYRSRLPPTPFFMLPPSNSNSNSNDDTTQTQPFFNLSSRKVTALQMPEIHQKWCCGSSQGWLLTANGFTGEVQLFNPVSKLRIQLPSLFNFSFRNSSKYGIPPEPPTDTPRHYIHKVVLSSNPCRTSESDYVVVVIVTNQKRLAYYKPAGSANRWTNIVPTTCGHFEDAIFYEGLLHVVSNHGPILTFDFSSEPPIEREISRKPADAFGDMFYLVQVLGELLLVSRHLLYEGDTELGHFDDEYYRDISIVHPPFVFQTIKFWVYKMDETKRVWIRTTEGIGDNILFLGNSSSISLPAQELFPGCKGNSIYFNQDWDYGPYEPYDYGYHDTGVFNFESRRVESFLQSPPPILTTRSFWFTPEPFGTATINFISKLFDIN